MGAKRNARQAATKSQRLNIRATEEEKSLLEQAARAMHVTASHFVLQAALESAGEVLAHQTTIVVGSGDWARFVQLLDRPAREVSALRRAASAPSPFE